MSTTETKTPKSKFVLGSTEAAELLNIPKQKLYSMRDRSTHAKNPRRPVLIRGEHWEFEDGNVMFSMKTIDQIKAWKESQSERKEKIKAEKRPDLKIMVIINGQAQEISGKLAVRIQKIVTKANHPVSAEKSAKKVKVQKPSVAKQKTEAYIEPAKVEA